MTNLFSRHAGAPSVLRAIHVLDHPSLRDTEDFLTHGTWPGRTTMAIRRVEPDIPLECCFLSHRVTEPTSFVRDGVVFNLFPAKLPSHGPPRAPAMLEHLRQASREGVIFHVHGYPTWLFREVARLGAPMVAQDHGRNPRNYEPKTPLHVPLQRFRRLLDERPLRHVDQFYYIGAEEGARLARLVGHERIRFQTMGVNVARFQPGDRRSAREKLALDPDARWLLYVGSDMPRKGADIAVESLEHLDADVRLALVGFATPDFQQTLEATIQRLGLRERVSFLGHLKDELLPDAYRAADLFVIPSRWEGTQMTVAVMEALATNVPVVASRAGASRELLNGYGIVTDELTPKAFADATRRALAQGFAASRDFASRSFGWDAIARATVADYRRIWKQHYGDA